MIIDNNGWIDVAIDGHYGWKSMDRAGHAAKYVVFHGSAGGVDAAAIDNWFTNGLVNGQPVQASSNIIIDQNGTIIQGISLLRAAWANGALTNGHAAFLPAGVNPNYYTISIEFVKNSTDNSSQLTEPQIQAGIAVTKAICSKYGIPYKRADSTAGGIITHAEIDPVNRSRCPGAFPWDRFFPPPPKPITTMLGGGMYQPNNGDFNNWFTKLNDNQWKCKQTGKVIQFGIKDFYARLSIDGGKSLPLIGLPKSDEIYTTDSDGKRCVIQHFERASLKYREDGQRSQPGCTNVSLIHQ